jgi:hypothetical protein
LLRMRPGRVPPSGLEPRGRWLWHLQPHPPTSTRHLLSQALARGDLSQVSQQLWDATNERQAGRGSVERPALHRHTRRCRGVGLSGQHRAQRETESAETESAETETESTETETESTEGVIPCCGTLEAAPGASRSQLHAGQAHGQQPQPAQGPAFAMRLPRRAAIRLPFRSIARARSVK